MLEQTHSWCYLGQEEQKGQLADEGIVLPAVGEELHPILTPGASLGLLTRSSPSTLFNVLKVMIVTSNLFGFARRRGQ